MPVSQMGRDLLGHRSDARRHLRLDLRRQILVREIDRRFEMRHKPQEPLAPAAIDPAEMAVELAQGLAALRLRFGRREIGDRLGLGQVELVVQKGAAGELAGLGEPQSPPRQCRHDRRQNGAAAMHMKFGDILAGDAVRRRKP